MTYTLSKPTRLILALTLISLPSVEFGGWFLLNYALGNTPEVSMSPTAHDLARGGHGHAGLFLVLACISLLLVDATCLHDGWKWFVRLGPGSASLLASGGMFALAFDVAPGAARLAVMAGALVLAASLITLAVGLWLSTRQSPDQAVD
jgi:hypothetical protein